MQRMLQNFYLFNVCQPFWKIKHSRVKMSCVLTCINIDYTARIYLFRVSNWKTRTVCHWRHGTALLSLLLNLSKFQTLFCSFYSWIQTSKCWLGRLNFEVNKITYETWKNCQGTRNCRLQETVSSHISNISNVSSATLIQCIGTFLGCQNIIAFLKAPIDSFYQISKLTKSYC